MIAFLILYLKTLAGYRVIIFETESQVLKKNNKKKYVRVHKSLPRTINEMVKTKSD